MREVYSVENEEAVLIKMPFEVEKKIKDLKVKGISRKTFYNICYGPKIEGSAYSGKPINSGEPIKSGELVGYIVFIR